MALSGEQRKERIKDEHQNKRRKPVFTVIDWAKTSLKFAEWEVDALHRERPNEELLDYYKNYLPGFDYDRHFPPGWGDKKVNRKRELSFLHKYATGAGTGTIGKGQLACLAHYLGTCTDKFTNDYVKQKWGTRYYRRQKRTENKYHSVVE